MAVLSAHVRGPRARERGAGRLRGPGARRRRCARLALAAGLLAAAAGGCGPRPTGTVAILTDYGTRDHYAGVLAAGVLRANPAARMVTLTHDIEPFNIAQGAFVLAEAGAEFPPGTVLLAIVDPGVGTQRAPIVALTQAGRILVGPDNGLLDPLIRRDGGVRGIWRIANPRLLRAGAASSTFHGRDLFAPVAGHLSRGVRPAEVGPPLESWTPLELPVAERVGHALRGAVVHVDRYGNILTNLPAAWLEDVPRGGRVEIVGRDCRASGVHERTYGDVPEGSFVVLANASGCVEVARNQASAAAWLGVRAGDAIELRPLD